MDKGLKQRDLLYVSNANETVNVYRYWQRTLAGVLTDFKQPMGACADSAGDVYCRETGNSVGCGTVFSLKPNGTETVLHSFGKSGRWYCPRRRPNRRRRQALRHDSRRRVQQPRNGIRYKSVG
jgi:uncharacterized repeat protein (TIGR03803 family)